MAIVAGTKFITYNPNLDLQERRSTGPNDKTRVYTIEDIVAATGAAVAGTYIEVDISSAQILALNSAVELLPTSGVGNYYDIEKMIFEFSQGATDYAATADFQIFSNTSDYLVTMSRALITNTDGIGNKAVKISLGQWNSESGTAGGGQVLNENLDLFMSPAPTLGDGTIKVKIWYSVRAFG
jgi:hypothetical protein